MRFHKKKKCEREIDANREREGKSVCVCVPFVHHSGNFSASRKFVVLWTTILNEIPVYSLKNAMHCMWNPNHQKSTQNNIKTNGQTTADGKKMQISMFAAAFYEMRWRLCVYSKTKNKLLDGK